MGASDSKLVFKQGIFKLSEQKDIPADDPYWAGFWELPESAEDVFSLFSPVDIRRIRDESLANLETLVLAVTSRLFALKSHPSFPDPEQAPERDALNCIRILTRLLPFLYESEQLEPWDEKFFWGARRRRVKRTAPHSNILFDGTHPEVEPEPEDATFEEVKPLAEALIDTLVDLLFFSEFTLPKVSNDKGKISLAIWQSGVGCNTAVGTSQELEGKRMEVLRLLLVLASKSMYTPANVLPVQGVRAITYITTISDKQLVLTLLCSLLNTTLKYNPSTWRVPYDHVVFKDPKQMYVTYCLELLLVLVVYPVPESTDGIPPKNFFRHFLGRLHRPQDFQFLFEGMTKILNQPLQATTSYLPGSQKSLSWAPEMIMLFWEVLQCNKRFRSFIVETDRAHDFVVLVLFQAMQHKNDPARQGIVRMCVFVLQTLSVESTFGTRLNKPFKAQDTLPQILRIPSFRGTYADFLIISVYTLLTTGKGKLDAIYPALLAIINNIAPHVLDLSALASSKLMQLFSTMSSPTFLFANETNHVLLRSLLEAINAIMEHQYGKNPILAWAIVRSQRRFQTLRDLTVDGAREELERQDQLRKDLPEDTDRLSSPTREVLRSPTGARAPSLSNVPEEGGAFAIGDDDDDDSDGEGESKPTPVESTITSSVHSRTGSVADSMEDAVPAQLRGMSEKARGKLPMGQASFSRHSSNASLSNMALSATMSNTAFEPNAAWTETWLPELPLHTTLTLIHQLKPQLPRQGASTSTSEAVSAIRKARISGIEPGAVRVHLFEWSPLSLGWYESVLWGFIFSAEMAIIKAGPGVWKGTQIKLFRVQETASQGPTIMAPQGAVDAVGSTLVRRIGSLNLRGSAAPTPRRSSNGGVVRDV